jgi:glycosyltransferase involved in cell wall biosynthesis
MIKQRATSDSIRISLVVATLHDNGDLEHFLGSLAAQIDPPSFEVIIIDQNGDDRLCPLLKRFSSKLEIIQELVCFHSVNRARNLGVEKARGQWVTFPDDDCRYLPTLLKEVEQGILTPSVRVVTGQTVDSSCRPNVLRWEKQAQYFQRSNMFSCLSEATMFMERDLFIKAGGFDERFGLGGRYPAAEGIELMHRVFTVMGKGESAYFNPAVCMQHPTKIPPWTRQAVGRFYSYGCGDGALIAKHLTPHLFYWGFRTMGSAVLHVFSFRGWCSLAYAARVVGLCKGFFHYLLIERLSWRGKCED